MEHPIFLYLGMRILSIFKERYNALLLTKMPRIYREVEVQIRTFFNYVTIL